MHAPANITVPVTMEDLWTPEERAHRKAISIHCPNEGETAMACRAHIAAIRDAASAGMRRCGENSYAMLQEIARIATMTVYAPMSAKRLMMMRLALSQAMEAARALERASRNGQ